MWGVVGVGAELVFRVVEEFGGREGSFVGVVWGFIVRAFFDGVVESENIGGLCLLGDLGVLRFVAEVEGREGSCGGIVSNVWEGVVVSYAFLAVVGGRSL